MNFKSFLIIAGIPLIISSSVFARTYRNHLPISEELKTQYTSCIEISNVRERTYCNIKVFQEIEFQCSNFILNENKDQQVIDCINAYGQWLLKDPNGEAQKNYEYQLSEIRLKDSGDYGRVMDALGAIKDKKNNHSRTMEEAFLFHTTRKMPLLLKKEFSETRKSRMKKDNELVCLPEISKAVELRHPRSLKVENFLHKRVRKLKQLTEQTTQFLSSFHAFSFGRVSPLKNQINIVNFCLPSFDAEEGPGLMDGLTHLWSGARDIVKSALNPFTFEDDRRMLFRDYTLFMAPSYSDIKVSEDEMYAAWDSPDLIKCEATEEKFAGTKRAKVKYVVVGQKACLIREALAKHWGKFNPMSRTWSEVKMAVMKIKRLLFSEEEKSLEQKIFEINSALVGNDGYFTDAEKQIMVQLVREKKYAHIEYLYKMWKQELRDPKLLSEALVESFRNKEDSFEKSRVYVDNRITKGKILALNNNKRIIVESMVNSLMPSALGSYSDDFSELNKAKKYDHPCYKKDIQVDITKRKLSDNAMMSKIPHEQAHKSLAKKIIKNRKHQNPTEGIDLDIQDDFKVTVKGPGLCHPEIVIDLSETEGWVALNLIDDVEVNVSMPNVALIKKIPLKKSLQIVKMYEGIDLNGIGLSLDKN